MSKAIRIRHFHAIYMDQYIQKVHFVSTAYPRELDKDYNLNINLLLHLLNKPVSGLNSIRNKPLVN